MSSTYRRTLDVWLAGLNVKADTVVDVGGSQVPVKNRVASWDVKNYYIADMEDPHENSPRPDFIVDLNGHSQVTVKADLVFCLEVFEYVHDPVNAWHILSKMLNPGGQIWVSWPFVYPTHNPIQDDSLRYTLNGMTKLAEMAGLKLVVWSDRRPQSDLLQEFYRAEGLRAAKGFDHNTMGYIARFKK